MNNEWKKQAEKKADKLKYKHNLTNDQYEDIKNSLMECYDESFDIVNEMLNQQYHMAKKSYDEDNSELSSNIMNTVLVIKQDFSNLSPYKNY